MTRVTEHEDKISALRELAYDAGLGAMSRLLIVAPFLGVIAAACTSERESFPPRTAMEQLLISGAVDDALKRLRLDIPAGTRIWVDAGNFDGYDQKYAVGAIRDRLLWLGAQMVADRGSADTVVEIRSGGLSIESTETLLALPGAQLAIPYFGNVAAPEGALLKSGKATGVAKIGLTAYSAKTGALEPFSPPVPVYGFSHRAHWDSLFVGWTEGDVPRLDTSPQ